MCEETTQWKQKFYYDVKPIRLREPLAEFLGAVDEGEDLVFSYVDVVKFAGHSCPAVSGAYRIVQHALQALFGREVPVRGTVSIVVPGSVHHGANGPISQVIGYITGAATETGFAGLSHRFVRKNKIVFQDEDEEPHTFVFTRDDTGKSVKVRYHPELLPRDEDLQRLYIKCIADTASNKQKEKFKGLWQKRVRAVLTDEIEGLFTITEVKK